MITQGNYFKTVEELGLSKLPDELKSAHDFLIRATKNGADWERVNKSAALKEVKDLQFAHLEKLAAGSEKKAPKPKKDGKQVKLNFETEKAAGAQDQPEPKQKVKKEKAAPKPKKEKQKTAAQQAEEKAKKVGHYSVEQRLIRRFASYDGRKVSVKVLLLFIKGLQKAMAELSVRKTSQLAPLLARIQDTALAQYQAAEKAGKEFVQIKFESDWAKGLHEVAKQEAVIPTVPLLKRYIGLLGTKPSLEKVERLLKAIKTVFSSGRVKADTLHRAELKEVQTTLEEYVAKRRSNIEVSKATLNGLEGFTGKKRKAATKKAKSDKDKGFVSREERLRQLNYNLKESASAPAPRASSFAGAPGVVGMAGIGSIGVSTASVFGPATYNGLAGVDENVEDGEMPAHLKQIFAERQRTIKPLRLPGDLGRFLGDLEQYEYALVLRGEKGAGKSRLMYQLMNLFSSVGMTVADFSLEMAKDSKVAKDYEAAYIHPSNRPRIQHADELPQGLETIRQAAQFFDVIVIDSWSKIGVKQEEFDKLRKEFKNVLWIVIFQSTTAGTARGGIGAEYDAGAVLQVQNGGIAVFEKNRYATAESMELAYKVFEQKAVSLSSAAAS